MARTTAPGLGHRLILGSLCAAVLGLGCGGARPDASLATTTAALTNADAMGFETPGAWSTTTAGAVLGQSPAHSQGSSSLSMRPSNAKGYTPLSSAPLSTLAEVSNTLAWDVMLPFQRVNPQWAGTAQTFVNCPSRGIINMFLGQVELTGKPINVWTPITFTLSNAAVSELLMPGYTDLTFTLVLNVPVPTTATYLVDNLRFIPAAANACGGKPNGSACNDNNACTMTDRCENGACRSASVVTCAASDQCHAAGTCNPATGVCSNPVKADGATCDDGQLCTQGDVCKAGKCGGAPVVCAATDQCHAAGVCDPTSGACTNPAIADGTSCDDGQLCTQGDVCTTGKCGGAPVVCAATDQCHAAGVCDPTSGACTDPAVADGTSCDDGQLCTQKDVCAAGICGGAPVVCAAADQCHAAGVCDPTSGACTNPAVADGTSCNDGNACTLGDACTAGACGGAPVVCAATDQCHVAGVCDPTSGACTNPIVADGTSCNDGDACTTTDHCVAGACAAGDPVVCPQADVCHPGTCDPASGACSNPVSCALYGTGVIASTATDGLVVSPARLENGQSNNLVGGIGSAIAYTGVDDLFVVSPDRGPADGVTSFGERYYLLQLSLAGGQVTPSIRGGALLDQGPGLPTFIGIASAFDATNSPAERRLDVEGVRVSRNGTLFVSDEYGPFIYEIAPDGHRLRSLPVPDKFLITSPGLGDDELPPRNTKGRQANRGMEGLAISPDGHRLYGMMQSPLIQDGGLDAANNRVGTNARILELDVDSGATRELLYPMADPSFGMNEILAVNDHQLLVLERDGKGGTSARSKRIYLIDIAKATDISGIAALPSTGVPDNVTPVAKTLFLDLLSDDFGLRGATFPEKIEGLSFGPDLPDGRHTLVATTDNDFLPGNDSRLFVFAIDARALPGLVAQQPTGFPTVCASPVPVSCPATGACTLPGTCNPATGACSTPVVAPGTPVGAQVAGDCHTVQCDSAGNVVDGIDDTDVPVDGLQCTGDMCSQGVPSNPALAAGAACSQNGGTVCDGAGLCVDCRTVGLCPVVPPTFRVLRIGDGTGTLSSAASATFIDERRLDGSLVGTVALPVAPNGNNLPFSLSGSASSDGGLSLSGDGHFLVVPGYAATPGTPSVVGTATATVNRVVARIDAAGNVDTSSAFTTAFNANNVRGAATFDGTGFWAAGAGGATAGVWFVPLGTRGGTQLSSSNSRWPRVFGGQLYADASNSPLFSVFTVGTGLPTTTGQTVAVLPGLPTSAASPYGFSLLDRNPAVPGADTLYIADDRAAPAGGVQKWAFNGTTWSQVATFNVTTTPIGFRGLATAETGSSVTIVATTADGNTNRLVVFVDDGAATVTGQVIATAAVGTIYRGVALSPQ